MASRRARKMSGFTSVAAGNTAVVDLPPQGVYSKLHFNYKRGAVLATNAQVDSDIAEIRLMVNGVPQRTISGAQLVDINAYRGKVFADGQVELYLGEPWRREAPGEDLLAWGMADVDSFQVEVDIAAGALTPVLTGHYSWSPINRAMGSIIKVRRQTIPVSAVGEVTVDNLAAPGEAINAIHLIPNAKTDITAVKVVKDDVEEINITDMDVLSRQQSDYDYVPQANMHHLDFAYTRRVNDMLSVINTATGRPTRDLRMILTMAAANDVVAVIETMGRRS